MPQPGGTSRRGVILLEVILALALLAIAAAVVGSSMRQSLEAIGRMRRQHKAADLAESVLAQLSTGAIPPVDCPATALGAALGFSEEDALPAAEQGWTYEIVTEQSTDMTGQVRVQVIVRHAEAPEEIAAEVVQWVPAPPEAGLEVAP